MLIKNISKRGGGLNFQDWHDYPVGEQLLFRERWDELLTLLGKNHAHIGVSLLFTELGRLRMGYDQARTAIEIVQKIKQYCGEDFPVILRFSLKSYIKDLRRGAVPGETFTELGRDTDEGLQAARILVDAGYDALDVDAGTYDSWYWAHPPMYFDKGVYLPFAEQVKQAVDVPVLAEGDTVVTAVGMEANHALFDAIRDDYETVLALGDGRRVRNIFGAIWDGYEAARSLQLRSEYVCPGRFLLPGRCACIRRLCMIKSYIFYLNGETIMLYTFGGKAPQVAPTAFVSASAELIGDVIVGPRCYIGPYAVIRADASRIVLEEEVAVEDGVIIHTGGEDPVVTISRRVTIGHGAIIHARVIGPEASIGMGAVLSLCSEIGAGSIVAESALVPQGKIIPPETLVAGVPARPLRGLTDKDRTDWRGTKDWYVRMAAQYLDPDNYHPVK